MSHFYRQFALLFTSATLSFISSAQVLHIDPQSIEAQAWIVIDPQSKQVIAEHAADQQRAPASLTKMMVGYLTLKALEDKKITLNQIITVPEVVTTVANDESRLHLKPNDQITVEELLASLLIMSANDAALTLATTISGDVPAFVQLMNKTAQDLGMKNTHFGNPSGITMPNHYMSARDLSLLAQAIVLDTPLYLDYSKQTHFAYKNISHEATNLLLKKYPQSVDGFKTGFTKAAGYNLAVSANKIDANTQQARRILVVVMGSTSKQKRADVAETLMNIAYNYTQTTQLIKTTHKIASLPIINGQYSHFNVLLPPNASYHTLSLLTQPMLLNAKQFNNNLQRFVIDPNTQSTLEPLPHPQQLKYQTTLLVSKIDAPIPKIQLPLAEIKITQFNQDVHNIKVLKDIKFEEASLWQKICDWFQQWIDQFNGTQQKSVIYQIPSQ